MNDVVTPDDISLKIDEKEKEIQAALEKLNVVEEAVAKVKRELVMKEIEKDELVTTLRMGKNNLSRLRSERDNLNREYWRCKNR